MIKLFGRETLLKSTLTGRSKSGEKQPLDWKCLAAIKGECLID